ncbi:hypothetical protein GCM10027435_04030 [Haloparvum alkalitolerans]|uniref:HEWD family protein n=1 Tax=Haloparvum TaxID=1820337 RepID=UPI00159EBDE6|nr:HEWD family protein [Haloparvum sedimenti]
MHTTLRTPTERTCENCGRTETWSEDAETWLVADDPGNVYCVHEWDINGQFAPFGE